MRYFLNKYCFAYTYFTQRAISFANNFFILNTFEAIFLSKFARCFLYKNQMEGPVQFTWLDGNRNLDLHFLCTNGVHWPQTPRMHFQTIYQSLMNERLAFANNKAAFGNLSL